MALADLTDLRASLAGWLHRTDVNATATGAGVDNVVDDWIALFEAEANATLRLRVMESAEALTTTAGVRTLALPTGFLEPIDLRVAFASGNTPVTLRFYPADQIDQGVQTAPPSAWTIDGSNIAFDCLVDNAYAVTFRMLKAFGLTDAAPTNWLLTNFPNVYLYGALRHSSMYLMNDARIGGWERMYLQGLQTLEDKEARANTLATLSVDPALMFDRGSSFNIYRGN